MTKTDPPTTDVDRARELLLWLRRNRFAISHLRVGEVVLDGLVDLDTSSQVAAPKTEHEAARGLYERYGGELLDEATGDAEDVTVYEDDDDIDE